MTGYIPDETIEEIRAASDIVDIVSGYVRLKKQGRNFTGLCPFHNEKTPSFMVNQEKQIFRCFGCGEGGNVISFIMKRESLSFPEAARFLAARAGISIAENNDPVQAAIAREKNLALEINKLAKDFFRYILLHHNTAGEARAYIEKRGISPETAEMFQLGFSPPHWEGLLQFLRKKGHSEDVLARIGLVLARTDNAGYYDRFRNRVMFPIWNVSGKVVGFGGRVMDDSLPKYLNSPETVLFNKSQLLYALDKAADSIRNLEQVIVVEGYMDVIACHQAGITNVVASLGTALTREQGKLLSRYTREVIIAYDTDTAGINATMKGWQVLDDMGFRVRIAVIPDGKDPDEFIRNHGPEGFRDLVREKAMSLCDFKTDRAMEKYDIYTLEGKFKIASEVIPSIRNLSNQIEKDEAIINLARRLHLSPDAIRAETGKIAKDSRNSWAKRDNITDLRDNNSRFAQNNSSGSTDARAKAEEALMILMLENSALVSQVKDEIGLHFSPRQEYLNIIEILHEMVEKELDYQPAAILHKIDDKATADCLTLLLTRELPGENKEIVIRDCLKTIREDELRKKREDLLRQMEDADRNRDQELRNRLLLEYSRFI